MYFKIDSDTPTGHSLTKLKEQIHACNEQMNKLVDELGGDSQVAVSRRAIGGGICGIQFPDEVVPYGWKLVHTYLGKNFYWPKSSPKNKELLARLTTLPSIDRNVVNLIVGFIPGQIVGMSVINSVGMTFGDNYHLLTTDDDAEFSPNDDMIELNTTQFRVLKDQISNES
jgi:hypothetical protein